MSQSTSKSQLFPTPAVDLCTADVTGTLPVANGGTGGTDQAGARAGLGLGSLAVASTVDSTGMFTAGAAATESDLGVVKVAAHGAATAGSVVQADDPDIIRKMTEVERDALEDPADGLVIYNTTTHRLNFYDSNAGSWQEVAVAVD